MHRLESRWLLCGVVWVVLLSACSGTTGMDAGLGGGAGGSLGGGAGGGGGSTGGGGGASPKAGSIVLVQGATVAGGMTYYYSRVMVGFRDTQVDERRAGCSTSTVGGCSVTECDERVDAGTPTAPVPVSAGLVTVSGPTLATPDGGPLSFAFIPDAGYQPVDGAMRLWAAGDSLVVSASGATVPAFAKTVPAPADVTLMSPACALFNCGTLSRSAPLAVSWDGGAPIQLELSSTAGAQSVLIHCELASSPATIAAAAMGRLGATDAGFSNSLSATTSTGGTISAGEYTVEVKAMGLAQGAGQFTTSD